MGKVVPIIIVTYNKVHEFTIPCIRSVLVNTTHPYKIVVVDNASNDDTPSIVRSTFDSVDVFGSQENLGWAGGSLVGIEHIDRDYDYDYFCLLNSDTLVSKNWLSKLQKIMETHERAVSIVPTERVIGRNIARDFYNDYLSRTRAFRRLAAFTPLRKLMGKGLAVPKETKPVVTTASGPTLEEVDRLNSQLERWYGETVSTATFLSTGYCALFRRVFMEETVAYLNNFAALFPAKSVDYWTAVSRRMNTEHLTSRGTYVYHFRGGSGGYDVSPKD